MKEEYIKALEYIRVNNKLEEADISAKFGVVGLWTLSLFRGYRSNVRQKEGLTAMRNKKDEIIDTIENDIISGKIKTREEIQLEFIKEEEKQKKQLFIWKIIFGTIFFVSAVAMILIGGTLLLIIPPIWIIIILLIYIAKKI